MILCLCIYIFFFPFCHILSLHCVPLCYMVSKKSYYFRLFASDFLFCHCPEIKLHFSSPFISECCTFGPTQHKLQYLEKDWTSLSQCADFGHSLYKRTSGTMCWLALSVHATSQENNHLPSKVFLCQAIPCLTQSLINLCNFHVQY